MSVILSFNDKSGKPASITFPNRQLAEAYGRTVKNPKFTDSDTECAAVVTKCGSKEEEEQKRKEVADERGEKAYNICECGKRAPYGMTACYICRRYR